MLLTREQKRRLGIFLMVSIGVLVFIFGLFIIPKLKSQGETYYINFKEISVYGISNGSSVKYQGVDIGKVMDIEVNPYDLNSILVEVEIRRGFPVKDDMRSKLSYAGITGLKFIELSGGSSESKNLLPGGIIPMERGLGEKAEDIVSNIDKAVQNINKLLNEKRGEELSRILVNIEEGTAMMKSFIQEQRGFAARSMENMEKISSRVSHFTASLEKVDIEGISKQIQVLIGVANARFSKEELGKTMADFDELVNTSTASIRKTRGIILDIQSDMSATLEALRDALENLATFSKNLTEDPTILIRKRKQNRSRK